jgi:hypothetical protein
MPNIYDTKEHFITQLASQVKSYILSFNPKPEIIIPDAFAKHLYYYAFYDYIKKYQDKFNLRKNELCELISKAVYLAISQINLYKFSNGGYYLCK